MPIPQEAIKQSLLQSPPTIKKLGESRGVGKVCLHFRFFRQCPSIMDCLEIREAKIFWFTQGNLWKWNGFPFADILYIGKTDVWIQNPRAGRWIHRVICTLCFFRFLNNSGTPVLVLSLNPRSLVSSPTSDP